MRKHLFVLAFLLGTGFAYASTNKEMDKFVSSLMKKMTLREKLGQLNLQPGSDATTGGAMKTEFGQLVAKGEMGAVLNVMGKDKIRSIQRMAVEESRLGIPILFGLDVIHGYHTILPIPLAQSCSWNVEAIEQGARMAAEECSSDGISWTYSPMVDIALDARWGRIAEGNGEDPYLGSLIAAALVRGYQGDLKGPSDIIACLKHYALYGASESGKDYNTVDMSHLRMYNQYFPPYRAAVEAGVESVMTSFNLVDGLHATANPWLIGDVLRKQWGFKGLVVTDYASISEMTAHGFGDLKHNGASAMRAGTDMDMCSRAFIDTAEEALREGLISTKDIDQACRRMLEAKYKLGLFDDPYKHCKMTNEEQQAHLFTPGHRQAARDMAAETFVLLKNEGSILPLKKQGTIALIGPNAVASRSLLGTWCIAQPNADRYLSLRAAMEQAMQGKGKVLCSQGCNLTSSARNLKGGQSEEIPVVDAGKAHDEAMAIARQADVIVCAMGEGNNWSGESHSRTSLDLPDEQMALLRDLLGLGKPLVLLNFSGRPTVMAWESEHVPAIMNVWFGGTEMAPAICDVLFGDKVPCGRLTTSIPRATGQEPLYYNHLPTGRGVPDGTTEFRQYQSNYLDVPNGPVYPFGYGLSYTKFQYGQMDVKVSGRKVEATVEVTNTGDYDSYEVVQCYIHDVACRYSRPVKELKGFSRVFLRKGESRMVTITLDEKSLQFYDADGTPVFEPGEFDIMVGANSRDVQTRRTTVL